MSKPAKNPLEIVPLSDGRFFLKGFVLGRQIRLKHANLATLEARKLELEAEVARAGILAASAPVAQYTRLSLAQVQEAEHLFREFAGLPRSLSEYVRAGMGVLGAGQLVKVEDAMQQWESDMKVEKQLQERSITRNLQYLRLFIKEQKPVHVTDITSKMAAEFNSVSRIEAQDSKRGASIYSRLTRHAVIRAFLEFCTRREMIAVNPLAKVSIKDDLKLAKKRAKAVEVFTAAQCEALLNAAIQHDQRLVPFVILSLWLFARQEEVLRLTPAQIFLDASVPYARIGSHKIGTPNDRATTIPANVLPLLRECIETGLWAKGQNPFWGRIAFQNIRAKAGLLELSEPNAHGARSIIKSDWQKNALRHTGISMLYKKLSDMAERGEFKEAQSIQAAVTRQAGNGADVMFKFYLSEVSAEDCAKFYSVTGTLPKELAQDRAHDAA